MLLGHYRFAGNKIFLKMDILLKSSLLIHVLSGFGALIFGIISILSKKGGISHRFSGKGFYYTMTAVGITALILSFFKDIPFLLIIAVFSYYMTFTGYRYIGRYKKTVFSKWPDRIIGFSASLLVLVFGGNLLIQEGIHFSGLQPLFFIFSGILLFMIFEDFRLASKERSKNQLLLMHIGRMGGAYISTLTAFLVVNIKFDPPILIWLLPTAIGFPVIWLAIRKYRHKKKLRRP